MSVSYPYWSIARDMKLDYDQVLRTVQYLEDNPKALEYWLGSFMISVNPVASWVLSGSSSDWKPSSGLYCRVATAVAAEHQRRAAMMKGVESEPRKT